MTKIAVRAINDKGLEVLSEFLRELNPVNNSDDTKVPYQILSDEQYLTTEEFDCLIDPELEFNSRLEFCEYLDSVLPELFEINQFENHGLWAWLAFSYFPQIRNPSRRKSEYVYVIPSEYKNFNQRHWYRHSVRGPLSLYRGSNNEKSFVELLLRTKLNTMGALYENCFGNKKIRRNKLTQKTIVAMYQGEDGSPKKGFDSHGEGKGKGGLRRFISIILPRIQETFDTETLETDQFIKIWGREALTSQFCPSHLKV